MTPSANGSWLTLGAAAALAVAGVARGSSAKKTAGHAPDFNQCMPRALAKYRALKRVDPNAKVLRLSGHKPGRPEGTDLRWHEIDPFYWVHYVVYSQGTIYDCAPRQFGWHEDERRLTPTECKDIWEEIVVVPENDFYFKPRRGSRSLVSEAWARKAISEARPPGMPQATNFLDSGSSAWVFETADPEIVVRAAPLSREDDADRERMLLEPELQEGVVRVLAMRQTDEALVTWKERLDPYVEGFVLRRHTEEASSDLLGALLQISYGYPRSTFLRSLKILRRYPETEGLARALRAGLPNGDLDLHSNLGVTRDGRVVAYDL